MKKTIVVADRDESLQHAFMTVFSKAHFEIIHASNGREVERIAEKMNPDVYIVNVNLPKMNGIEVYKKLQKQKLLEKASFFFLKDETDTTELLGYQADGVIEKPINFFRVYETVTKEDEAVELTDLIDDKPDPWGQAGEAGGKDSGKSKAEKESRLAELLDKEREARRVAPPGEETAETPDLRTPAGNEGDDNVFLALTSEGVKSSLRQIGERLAAEIEAEQTQPPTETPLATPESEKASGAEMAAPLEDGADAAAQEGCGVDPVASMDLTAPGEAASTRRPTAEGSSANEGSSAHDGSSADDRPAAERKMENEPSVEEAIKKEVEAEARVKAGHGLPGVFGDRLRDVMDGLTAGSGMDLAEAVGGLEEVGGGRSELEAQFKTVLNQALEDAALKLSGRLAPILTRYVEDYVKQMLLEIAEKVIREEIEKLLKESGE